MSEKYSSKNKIVLKPRLETEGQMVQVNDIKKESNQQSNLEILTIKESY
jgi:hypothetical protein